MAENIQKRQTAYKVNIKDINESTYVQEKGFNPSYVVLKDKRKVSRASIIGVVLSVSNDENTGYSSIAIDDGSMISVRSFEKNNIFNNITAGSIVLVIGRPRKYGDENYILPEIIKEIKNKAWADFRKAELDIIKKSIGDEDKSEKSKVHAPTKTTKKEDSTPEPDSIIDVIKSRDNGEGVDIKDIMHIENAEAKITLLLKEGDIFEIMPGRYKVLE